MKEHPILFSTEMVRVILDGNKTITRRVITPRNSIIGEGGDWSKFCWDSSEIYTDRCFEQNCDHKHEHKAPLPWVDHGFGDGWYLHVPYRWKEESTIYRIYSKYSVGDRLWVRETLRKSDIGAPTRYKADDCPVFCDGETPIIWSFKKSILASIFMPRWASRITLEITGVRVERLQEINLADIQAEGIYDNRATRNAPIQIGKFKILWDSTNAKRGYSWAINPWVWVIEFKKLIENK